MNYTYDIVVGELCRIIVNPTEEPIHQRDESSACELRFEVFTTDCERGGRGGEEAC